MLRVCGTGLSNGGSLNWITFYLGSMDYLAEFLESCAGPYLATERIQRRLLVVLRTGLQAAGRRALRQMAAKGRRVVHFLQLVCGVVLTLAFNLYVSNRRFISAPRLCPLASLLRPRLLTGERPLPVV